MLVTAVTRKLLARDRRRRELIKAGYQEVTDNGGPLWKLHRGSLYNHKITHVEIDPGGRHLWVKFGTREAGE